MKKYKIHPAIGIARVGNSNLANIGPITQYVPYGKKLKKNIVSLEDPFDNIKMKDDQNRVKPQVPVFYIWEYDENGKPIKEINLSIKNKERKKVEHIRWEVKLSNTKATYNKFVGKSDFSDALQVESSEDTSNKRNSSIIGENRKNYEIHTEATIEIKSTEMGTSKQEPLENNNPNIKSPITKLGKMVTTRKGRLLIYGGKGNSESINGARIVSSFNNDDWFDDVSDGPVRAWIKFEGMKEVLVEPAWVMVGPPDFAPSVGNIVTMYDMLVDVTVRRVKNGILDKRVNISEQSTLKKNQGIYSSYEYLIKDKKRRSQGLAWLKHLEEDWNNPLSAGKLTSFFPSFTRDIYPILLSALQSDQVTKRGRPEELGARKNTTKKKIAHPVIKKLIDGSGLKNKEKCLLRERIFNTIKDPDSIIRNKKNQPGKCCPNKKTPGNEEFFNTMPALYGDDFLNGSISNSRFKVTRIQYAMLKRWVEGNFIDDWNPNTFLKKIKITPEELDKAALNQCVGGAFSPGIEVSWLIRTSEFFSDFCRLKIDSEIKFSDGSSTTNGLKLKLDPGYFTKQLAIPWSSDFHDCSQLWWPGQRPVVVDTYNGGNPVIENNKWPRDVDDDEDFVRNKWHLQGFIVKENGQFVEKGGPPTREEAKPLYPDSPNAVLDPNGVLGP